MPTEDEQAGALETCPELRTSDALLVVKVHRSGQQGMPRRYVVTTPNANPSWDSLPIGRATRTSVALDVQQKRRVFVNDSWRVIEDCVMEGEDYEILIRNKVRNVHDGRTSATSAMRSSIERRFRYLPVSFGCLKISVHPFCCFDTTA